MISVRNCVFVDYLYVRCAMMCMWYKIQKRVIWTIAFEFLG